MKEALFTLIDRCMAVGDADGASACLQRFEAVQLQLDEYYEAQAAPDFRLSKMLKNLQYYVRCWLDGAEYPRDWSTHLIGAIGRIIKQTAEYDFEIRYDETRRRARYQAQFDLYDQLKRQEKRPIEEEMDLPFDMTILMVTYNQLELTRLCLESVFQNTADVRYEVFLVDNGSTDGTFEYFKKDDRVKLIRLVENITLLPALQVFYEAHLDSGRFWMYMNNDVVVTPRWASLMLDCIRSDPRIAMAVPITNRTDPTLSIKPPMGLYDVDQIQGFGEAFNHKTDIWRECVVVWPFVGLMRPSLKRLLGHYEDYLHFKFYYADGDFLFAGRMSGYTFMQCANVYVHHFDGGATTPFKRRAMLDAGEAQFFEKYHCFPSDAICKFPIMEVLSRERPNAKILFVGCTRGNFVGDICHEVRLGGMGGVRFYCADTMVKLKLGNMWDFAEFAQIDDLYALDRAFPGETFDTILLDGNLASVRRPDMLLRMLFGLLRMNGNLIFPHENNGSLPAMQNIFISARIAERDRVRLRKNTVMDLSRLSALLSEAGFSIRSIRNNMLDETLSLTNIGTIRAYESLVLNEYDRAMLRLNMNRTNALIVAGRRDQVDLEHTMEQILYRKKSGATQ